MYVRFLFELVFSSPILLMLLDLVAIVCLCYSFKCFQWKASRFIKKEKEELDNSKK